MVCICGHPLRKTSGNWSYNDIIIKNVPFHTCDRCPESIIEMELVLEMMAKDANEKGETVLDYNSLF